MRIIGGRARGRRLRSPAGMSTRPMMDRAREALFSSLGTRIPASRVLDLYAGSGSLGLEALSRGAASAVFVEQGQAALKCLRENVDMLALGGSVVATDVGRFLAATDGPFDLVFVDPPYALELASVHEILKLIVDKVAVGGSVVLHRPDGEQPPEAPPGLVKVDERRYGGTRLWRYERNMP
ncbi:MAG: 16S rRNA (guanine(966)-N(2))-methyltransferase RsmD [Acidimicrobiia bacterium]|nr:16S rRNA (guanine(966)-N(2))-methyltransferase RsmD [Acidimicrobiia bacterium]